MPLRRRGAVNTIGQGLALARGLATKHAIKQLDRLLSNQAIDIDATLRHWVPHVVGPRTSIRVAMDWTGFDAGGQTTITLSLMTRHGRATPLAWLTVDAGTLKNHRNEHEHHILVRFADALPAGIKVCIAADRGFGGQTLYRFPAEPLKFGYVIRFRGNITVTSADGDERTAIGWVGPGGRATLLRGAPVTAGRHQVGTVPCVRDKDVKQAWCLATNLTDATASFLKRRYGKRWGIECGFRDTTDPRLGMATGSVQVSTPASFAGSVARRDRSGLLNALAIALPALLAAAGEALGHDRFLKPHTTKRRTHSWFRQGGMLDDLVPTMPEPRRLPSIERFAAMLAEVPVFADTFGSV
jgi:hypothetical protein